MKLETLSNVVTDQFSGKFKLSVLQSLRNILFQSSRGGKFAGFTYKNGAHLPKLHPYLDASPFDHNVQCIKNKKRNLHILIYISHLLGLAGIKE